MERAIGETFKVGKTELIVREANDWECEDEHGIKCYFYDACNKSIPIPEEVGCCTDVFREDEKSVVFIKK